MPLYQLLEQHLLHPLCVRKTAAAYCQRAAEMHHLLFLQAKKALERALRDDQYLQGIGQQLEVQVHEKAAYSIHA